MGTYREKVHMKKSFAPHKYVHSYGKKVNTNHTREFQEVSKYRRRRIGVANIISAHQKDIKPDLSMY